VVDPLYVSIMVGTMGATFAVGCRCLVPLDWLTFVLIFTGFTVTALAHAWWSDRYREAVKRGDVDL
jgi:hypothetical protein